MDHILTGSTSAGDDSEGCVTLPWLFNLFIRQLSERFERVWASERQIKSQIENEENSEALIEIDSRIGIRIVNENTSETRAGPGIELKKDRHRYRINGKSR
ncbi:hypothetical protein EVAR_100327_1 [Eumeta japonica]|uniref:Uncharacterized protein n=1 Tax=Eumeta variegata TaxID=151549 RepID=A0A4C1ZSR5_EUMVA|nr:hypothetical protein EVAR_100327_1 [Eumeta japonica]